MGKSPQPVDRTRTARAACTRARRVGGAGLAAAVMALGAAQPAAAQANQVPEWSTSIDGLLQDIDEAVSVAVDSQGDVIAGGLVFDVMTGPSFFVVKLAGIGGGEIWRVSLGAGGAESVAVDSADDVFAAGSVPGAGVDSDFIVVKFSGLNGAELWRTIIDGADALDDGALSVAVDPNDDVVAAGFSSATATGRDFFVVKLDGQTGAEIWTGVVDGTASADDEALQVVVDAAGEVFAAGLLRNAVTGSDFSVVKFMPEPSQALLLGSGLLGLLSLGLLRARAARVSRGPDE